MAVNDTYTQTTRPFTQNTSGYHTPFKLAATTRQHRQNQPERAAFLIAKVGPNLLDPQLPSVFFADYALRADIADLQFQLFWISLRLDPPYSSHATKIENWNNHGFPASPRTKIPPRRLDRGD